MVSIRADRRGAGGASASLRASASSDARTCSDRDCGSSAAVPSARHSAARTARIESAEGPAVCALSVTRRIVSLSTRSQLGTRASCAAAAPPSRSSMLAPRAGPAAVATAAGVREYPNADHPCRHRSRPRAHRRRRLSLPLRSFDPAVEPDGCGHLVQARLPAAHRRFRSAARATRSCSSPPSSANGVSLPLPPATTRRVAYHGRLLDSGRCRCRNSPRSSKSRTPPVRRRVILHGADLTGRARGRARRARGLTFIHPFDNAHVIAGQGTIALEILEQTPGQSDRRAGR